MELNQDIFPVQGMSKFDESIDMKETDMGRNT